MPEKPSNTSEQAASLKESSPEERQLKKVNIPQIEPKKSHLLRIEREKRGRKLFSIEAGKGGVQVGKSEGE